MHSRCPNHDSDPKSTDLYRHFTAPTTVRLHLAQTYLGTCARTAWAIIHVFPSLKARLLMHKHPPLSTSASFFVRRLCIRFHFWNRYQFELCGTLVFTDSISPIDGETLTPRLLQYSSATLIYHQLLSTVSAISKDGGSDTYLSHNLDTRDVYIPPTLTLVIIIIIF